MKFVTQNQCHLKTEFKPVTHVIFDLDNLLLRAERLIRHLAQHNVPMAVATSSGIDSVECKLQNHKELFSLISHMVMGSSDPDVTRGKPAPDIFVVCANRFIEPPTPDQCLVLEDAPNGILAAKNAGMQAILVPEKNLEEKHRENATLVIDTLLDFQPEMFGLPPFED